jgi:FkbM family methyltransferase
MPKPSRAQRLATGLARVGLYGRRLRRGLGVLQQLGRFEAIRTEARMTLGRLDYPAEEIYLVVDSRYAPMRMKSCAKEPWTVEWLEKVVGHGETVYDIGANVGAYSLVAAKLGRRVVAIEPAYASFAALCENIIVNDESEAIYPLAVTLGPATELGFFNYRDVEPGSGLNSTGDRPFLNGRFKPIYRQPVLTYRLDDLVDQFALPPPNHLKLDVDGAEAEVLRGATRSLQSDAFQTVMVEVNEDETDEVVGLLEDNGLALRHRYDPITKHGHWYGLFART